MRYIFSILFLFPTILFSQTIDLRIPIVTTVGNTDSLNGKPASFYVDTATTQSIAGVKTFKDNIIIEKDLLPNSTGSINLGSQTKRIKKLWLGGGSIDINGVLISTDEIDGGLQVGNRLHIKTINDTIGSVCFHPGQYMPLVNPDGYRMWVDSTINKLKWLLPNSDTSIRVNYGFVMSDTSGNVGIGASTPDAKLDVRGAVISQLGFATKLWDIGGGNFETAVVNTEYYSPNQQGGIYGTIYRTYFTTSLPSYLTTGSNVSSIVDAQLYVSTAGTRLLMGAREIDATGTVAQIILSGTSGNGNFSLDIQTATLIRGWVDYTK